MGPRARRADCAPRGANRADQVRVRTMAAFWWRRASRRPAAKATSEQKSKGRISISFKCQASETSNLTARPRAKASRHYFNAFRRASESERAQSPPTSPTNRAAPSRLEPKLRGVNANSAPSSSSSSRYYRAAARSFDRMHFLLVVALLMPPAAAAEFERPEVKQLVKQAPGLISLASNSAARQTARSVPNPDAPKLIPLSALDRYQEGADLRLFCSASAPKHAGRLHFEWRKDSSELANENIMQQQQQLAQTSANKQLVSGAARRIQISSMEDEGASLLRISQLESYDSGNYTCLVRNQHGLDSSTVRVQVNVGLKWTLEPPAELQVKAGKAVQLECDASGQPAPLISWTSIKDHRTIDSKVLRIERANANHSGLYECRASGQPTSSELQHGLEREQLRKIVRLVVNGK